MHHESTTLLVAKIKFSHGSASAAFSVGASTVPRHCPRFLMIDTRQLRSLALGFFLLVIGLDPSSDPMRTKSVNKVRRPYQPLDPKNETFGRS